MFKRYLRLARRFYRSLGWLVRTAYKYNRGGWFVFRGAPYFFVKEIAGIRWSEDEMVSDAIYAYVKQAKEEIELRHWWYEKNKRDCASCGGLQKVVCEGCNARGWRVTTSRNCARCGGSGIIICDRCIWREEE